MQYESLGRSVEADPERVARALLIFNDCIVKQKLVPKDAGDEVYRIATVGVPENPQDERAIRSAMVFLGMEDPLEV